MKLCLNVDLKVGIAFSKIVGLFYAATLHHYVQARTYKDGRVLARGGGV